MSNEKILGLSESDIILGTCPNCEGEIIDKGKLYGCTDYPKCKFSIHKVMYGMQLSGSIVRELINKGFTAKRFELHTKESTKRDPKTYTANLVLENKDNEFKVRPELALPLGDCPACKDGVITERENVFKCNNDKCGAYSYKNYWEIAITANHMRKLLGSPGYISADKQTKDGSKKRIRLRVTDLFKQNKK